MRQETWYIGVCGAMEAGEEEKAIAERVGREVARKQAILVTGGLSGVMEKASEGAWKEQGKVVGILPGSSRLEANPYIHVAIATNMGHARNVILVHTVDGILVVGGEAGTLSEIALAVKLRKPVVIIKGWQNLLGTFSQIHYQPDPEKAVHDLLQLLNRE